jgi:hypothetical protein
LQLLNSPWHSPEAINAPGSLRLTGFDARYLWKLDRLGRSLRHLIDTVGELQDRHVGFRSVQESVD